MSATMPAFVGAISGRHLGRRRPTAEMKRRALPFSPFLKRMGAKPPPDSVDYVAKARASLGQILGNDQYGDCTIAAALHEGAVKTAHQPGGAERVPTVNEAVKQYVQVCGPGDNGCYIPEVLDWQRDKGLQVGGKLVRSDGYVSCELGDQLAAKIACYLFGGLHLGINLPRDWYTHADEGFTWDVTDSDIVGGHSVAVVGYDSSGLKISTWGKVGTMTWNAFADRRFVEECYATLSPDWYSAAGVDQHGVNVQALLDALAAIRAGGDPVIPDGPTPTPPTPTPPTPGVWDWSFDRTLNALGYALHVHAGIDLHKAGAQLKKLEWFALALDVAKLVRAFVAKDYAAMGAAILAIARDLGLNLGGAEFRSVVDAMNAEMGPPARRYGEEKNPPADYRLTDGEGSEKMNEGQ